MDAFVTRQPSTGPIRTSSSSSSSSATSKQQRRLPPSSAIPSFFQATHSSSSVNSISKGKGKAREAIIPAPLTSSLPAAHSSKLKKAVDGIAKSLKASDNPITNSASYSSAFHYVSCSSGHQTSNGRSRSSMNSYNASRTAKLKAQGEEAQSGIFAGVRAYINGITTPLIGNLELIKLVQRNGGEIRYAFSKRGCTHIICTQNLSASKTHKEMTSRSNTKVVTPQWVLDSIAQGKKLAESRYSTLKSETQASIKSSLVETTSTSSSASASPPAVAEESGSRSIDLTTSPAIEQECIHISSSQ